MAGLGLNRGQIVTQGLELAGNTAITTHAEHFLNRFLDHFYRSLDFDFLKTTASVSTGTPANEMSLSGITDYDRIRRLRLDTIKGYIREESYENVWQWTEEDNDDSVTGTPSCFCIKPDKSKILLYPVPNKAYTGSIIYYKLPSAITIGVSGDSTVPDFPDSLTLVEAVKMFALEWDKDPGFTNAFQTVVKSFRETMANIADSGRSNAVQMEMDGAIFSDMKLGD